MFKWFAGLTAVAAGLAVATAFSGSAPEVMISKGDRLDVRPVSMTCPQFEWPYGCQWDAQKSRRAERPTPGTRNQRTFRNRASAGAKARRMALARATPVQATD